MLTEKVVKKYGIWDLVKCRNYTIMLIGNLISRFGDSLDGIAYGWMVYMLTGSKLLLGSLFAVNAIPNIVFSPFAGVLADRLDKKKLIILSYTGRGVVVSITAMMYMAEILRPWHLFLFTFINSSLETLMSPALISMLPLIIKKEMYLSANSFSSSMSKFAELIGTAIAGAVIALVGISGAIYIDGATFFIAAVFICLIQVSIPKSEIQKFTFKNYIGDLKEGASFLRNSKLIRTSIALFALINFCLAPINVLMPVFTKDILKGGPEILSAIGVSLAVGSILGGLIISQVGYRFKISSLLIGSTLLFGITYALLVLPGNVVSSGIYSTAIAVSCFFFIGFLIPSIISPIQTYLMSNTDRAILGRVSSIMTMINCSAIPLGSAFTGIFTEYAAISAIFLCMGSIISLASVYLLTNREFRNA
jgi:DHA3 family macrolide efflux protein-like MFS transporter